MKKLTAYFNREQYAEFVENNYHPHQLVAVEARNELDEETFEVLIDLYDHEFLRFLFNN
jgi:hypothetical protein